MSFARQLLDKVDKAGAGVGVVALKECPHTDPLVAAGQTVKLARDRAEQDRCVFQVQSESIDKRATRQLPYVYICIRIGVPRIERYGCSAVEHLCHFSALFAGP